MYGMLSQKFMKSLLGGIIACYTCKMSVKLLVEYNYINILRVNKD